MFLVGNRIWQGHFQIRREKKGYYLRLIGAFIRGFSVGLRVFLKLVERTLPWLTASEPLEFNSALFFYMRVALHHSCAARRRGHGGPSLEAPPVFLQPPAMVLLHRTAAPRASIGIR